jgi:hypothetical protein
LLSVAVFFAATLLVAGSAALLGVMLGQRAIVLTADSMRQAAVISVEAGSPSVQMAMRAPDEIDR